MALSYVQYEGDGTQETFAIPFPYLDKSHIEVRVNLDVTPYTWDDPNTIRISPAPPPGAVIEARRITPRETRMVDFVDGSVLTESDLDIANLQTFYIVQEAIDIAGGTLELKSDGSYGAHGRRISDLGNPVNDRDAVTKLWAETAMSSQLAQANYAKDASVNAKVGAEAARDAAYTARDAALSYRNLAEDWAIKSTEVTPGFDSARTYALRAAADLVTIKDIENNIITLHSQTVVNKEAAEAAATRAEEAADRAMVFDPAEYISRDLLIGMLFDDTSPLGPPPGFLFADGREVSRTTYAKLFARIGTTYGAGDGETTFNLPDARGRATFGVETAATARLSAYITSTVMGTTGGSQHMQSHTHTGSGTTSEIGSHQHWINLNTSENGWHSHWVPFGSYSSTIEHTVMGGPTKVITGYVYLNGRSTDGGGNHIHNVQGPTDWEGAHSHTYSFTTSTAGSGTYGNLPPLIIVRKVIYTGVH